MSFDRIDMMLFSGLVDEVVGMADGVENLWKVADVIADHGRRFGHISTIESRQRRRFKFEIILCAAAHSFDAKLKTIKSLARRKE